MHQKDGNVVSPTLQDIPGYISPNSRAKILGGNDALPSIDDSGNGEMMRTLVYDGMQDTMYEEQGGRKNSQGSFSSGIDDRSSRSNSSKQRSESEFSHDSCLTFFVTCHLSQKVLSLMADNSSNQLSENECILYC